MAAAAPAPLLAPLPGGMPHFPVQDWEQDMERWVHRESANIEAHRLVPGGLTHHTPLLFMELYKRGASTRHIDLDTGHVHANALILASRYHRTDSAPILHHHIRKSIDGGKGPGTREWHFLVERLVPTDTRYFFAHPQRHGPYVVGEEYSPAAIQRSKQNQVVHAGLFAEERRRADAMASRRSRSNLAVSDFARKPPFPIDPDSLGLVGQFVSAHITARPVPGIRATGPLVSNAVVLARIAAEAQAALDQPAASQVNALARTASQLANLVESINKRQRRDE